MWRGGGGDDDRWSVFVCFCVIFMIVCQNQTNKSNKWEKKRYVLHWSMGCWWGRCWCPKTYSPKNNSSNNDITEIPNALRTLLFALYCCFQHWFNWNPSSIYPSIHTSIHRSHPYPYPSTTSNVKWLWRQKKISAKTISSKLNKTHPMLHRLGHIYKKTEKPGFYTFSFEQKVYLIYYSKYVTYFRMT